MIRAIQMGLKARGYYSGVIDGLCGEATIKGDAKSIRNDGGRYYQSEIRYGWGIAASIEQQ